MDSDLRRHSAIRLLAAASVGLRELDEPRFLQHPHVKVEMTWVDGQALRELAVGQAAALVLAEELERAEPQRMAKRLELVRPVEYEEVAQRGALPICRRGQPI